MSAAASAVPSTLFVGAPTRLGHAVNDLVRANGARFHANGIATYPNRIVKHALRAAIGDETHPRDLKSFFATPSEPEIFPSGPNALGRPATVLRKGEFFRSRMDACGHGGGIGQSHQESGCFDRTAVPVVLIRRPQ